MGAEILLTVGCAVVLPAIVLAVRFSHVRRQARRRFAAYTAQALSIKTDYGQLSYIDAGRGEVILSSHGICGGYDQAYDTLAAKTDSYRVLAPARFGYPGSDMPPKATIELQADAFCALLDRLGIERAYLLATSAGSPSAIAFARKYPRRTKGLILYCSAYPGLSAPPKPLTLAGPPAFLCSDLAMWLISPLFEPIMGMAGSTIRSIMPMEGKKAGIVFDSQVSNTVMVNHYQDYDLSALEVPVLMVHARDDKLAPFAAVEPWAQRIPDCTAAFFASGGHLMSGNGAAIDQAFEQFVARTA